MNRPHAPIMAGIGVLTAGVFALDLAMPSGYAVGSLYLFPLLLTIWVSQRRATLIFATICTGLIVLGFLYSRPGIPPELAATIRVLGIAVLWLTAMLVLQRKRLEEALRTAYGELERRVEARTVELQAVNDTLKREIAERRQAEEARRESEARLQAIMDASPAMIFVKDAAGRYLLSNREFEKITRLAGKEVPGKTDEDLFPPEEAAAFRANDRKVLQAGVPMQFEEVALQEDGPHTSIVYKFPLLDSAGRVYAVGGIVTDITERKTAEEGLRQSELQYRLLFERSPLPMWVFDLDTLRFLEVNEAAVRQYGYSREEFLSMAITDIRPPEDVSALRAYLESIRDRDEPVFRKAGVWRHRKKDGSLLKVAVGLSPARFKGHERAMLVQVHDLTDRVRLEEMRMEFLNKLMTVQEEDRARLARELHDETGQSLTSLLLGLRTLQAARTLSAAKAHATRLREVTVQAMREVQRLAHGLRPVALDDLGLEAALTRHAAEVARANGLSVAVDVIGLDAVRLPAHMETALYRIAQEALTNTARHARARNVDILLHCARTGVQMIVEDDGIGFEEHVLSQSAGAPFHLGLHGMRERVAMLQGSIVIESAPGKGTTISATIPLAGGAG